MPARLALAFQLALVGTTVLGPGLAWADERPVLVVDATGGAGAAIAERLTRALSLDPALRPASAGVIEALAAPTPSDDAARTTAGGTLGVARDRLARFAHREAATLARAAQDGAASDADRPAGRELLADLAFVEAMAIAGDVDLAAAAPTFALVHRLTPGRTLDPARYVPEVIAAFEAAAIAPTATGVLLIGAPGATEILVDGVVIGAEPISTQVAPGPHIVSARGELIRGAGRRIEAAAGQTVRVDLISVVAPLDVRVARARDRLVAATTDVQRTDAITTLLELGGATDAVILFDLGGQVASRLYTARGGLGPARPVGDDLAAVLRPLRPVPKLVPPPGGERDPDPTFPDPPVLRWYERRYAKIGFGVGAGAIVVAVVAALVMRDPGSSALMPMIEVD